FTFDNASNNNTLMEALERLLTEKGIPFDKDAHTEYLEKYAEALESDPVGSTHKIVTACRKSGQRRADLQQVIKNGYETCMWGKVEKNGTEEDLKLCCVQLLHDCETCWLSTHLMVDRLIELYAAVQFFLAFRKEVELQGLQLTQDQFQVLNDLSQILLIPHQTQELLSAEKTPTICAALPAYELLVDAWQKLRSETWELSHYIGVGVAKIDEYTQAGRKSRIYALAMIVNPASKMTWIKDHWTTSDTNRAREWMIESVCGTLLMFLTPCLSILNVLSDVCFWSCATQEVE
ncbi:hypothetical protein HYDPIDRAFT_102918, partial [Hydnomerulius pinastri MD-312]